ncbi:sugar-binding protein, putative [Marinomonas sp. MED121]|uniref:substrate-binding domain-containing protein n=1 Tax=Marinomonas sp. MED121 TaxID=314277 RepID=UPI00006910E8|nr:substrate-binding domain-containing protein [Marinomonas sp. MED121]EAQ67681.1 sugar-binding protein, putative [Marinomonas sp. MED121]
MTVNAFLRRSLLICCVYLGIISAAIANDDSINEGVNQDKAASLHSPGLNIVVIGKTKNDSFYEQSYEGCQVFAQSVEGVNCIYDGPQDFQNIRAQALIIESYLKTGVDGFLISTTDSTFLVNRVLKKAKAAGVPVITFDSDLLASDKAYRLAYVGTNNFDYGVALGNQAKAFKKQDLTQICIQSGHDSTPNLNERIRGVRYALAGENVPRLRGENGWTEYSRCPFYTLGKREQAVRQLEHILTLENPPIYLAVAGFAQFSPDYIKKIGPFKQQIANDDLVIISADAEDIQLDALRANLSSINIGQKPFAMGRLGAQLLYQYIKYGETPSQDIYYQDFYYCTPENVNECVVK